MAELGTRTIRVKLDTSVALPSNLDIASWRGNALDLEVGIFDTSSTVASITNVTSVNVKVQASQTDNTTLMDSTVAFASMDAALTAETWSDGTAQHATFAFTNAQANLTITDSLHKYWIVFTALLSSGDTVTLAAGDFTLHEDNDTTAGDPDVNPGTAITLEEADARYSTLAHASNHTDGTDDIQLATNAQKGLASAAHITTLESASQPGHTHTSEDLTDTRSGIILLDPTDVPLAYEVPDNIGHVYIGESGLSGYTITLTLPIAVDNGAGGFTVGSYDVNIYARGGGVHTLNGAPLPTNTKVVCSIKNYDWTYSYSPLGENLATIAGTNGQITTSDVLGLLPSSPQALTDAATIAVDVALGGNMVVTSTQNATLGAFTNASAGDSGMITHIQGGAGGFSLTLDASQVDMNGNLSDITALTTGKAAKIGWETHDAVSFYLYISTQP